MRKKIALSAIAAVMAVTALPGAAEAQYYGSYGGGRYQQPYNQQGYYGGGYQQPYNQGYYSDRYYAARGRQSGRYYGSRGYYGRDQRYYGRHCSGTAGTIIGAIAGGLLGNAVVGRHGDNTAGALVGAGAGALAGRAIDKSDCRR